MDPFSESTGVTSKSSGRVSLVHWKIYKGCLRCSAATIAKVVLPVPGIPVILGESGWSLSETTSQQAWICFNTSSCPIQVGWVVSGLLRCRVVPSMTVVCFVEFSLFKIYSLKNVYSQFEEDTFWQLLLSSDAVLLWYWNIIYALFFELTKDVIITLLTFRRNV